MVAFGFFPQDIRRWQGPMNDGLRNNECSLSGADTQTLLAVFKKFQTFCTVRSRDAKKLAVSPNVWELVLAPKEVPEGNFHYLIFLI